jgi:hypothetical protein
MYNLVTTRDNDFPKLKIMVNEMHAVFCQLLMEDFKFGEITMQKYYQATRSTLRLTYLADLVWQRLLVDRKKLRKQVNFLLIKSHLFSWRKKRL